MIEAFKYIDLVKDIENSAITYDTVGMNILWLIIWENIKYKTDRTHNSPLEYTKL